MEKYAWFLSTDNVWELASHLVERGDLSTPEDVLSYFEKPWKWDEEWDALCVAKDQQDVEMLSNIVTKLRAVR